MTILGVLAGGGVGAVRPDRGAGSAPTTGEPFADLPGGGRTSIDAPSVTYLVGAVIVCIGTLIALDPRDAAPEPVIGAA